MFCLRDSFTFDVTVNSKQSFLGSSWQIICTTFQAFSLVSFPQMITPLPLKYPACFVFQTTVNYPAWSCSGSKTQCAARCLICSTKASKNRGLLFNAVMHVSGNDWSMRGESKRSACLSNISWKALTLCWWIHAEQYTLNLLLIMQVCTSCVKQTRMHI